MKFSTLQDYGVDKVFFLENNNADPSQYNIVFIARSDDAKRVQSIAGALLSVKALPCRHYVLILGL